MDAVLQRVLASSENQEAEADGGAGVAARVARRAGKEGAAGASCRRGDVGALMRGAAAVRGGVGGLLAKHVYKWPVMCSRRDPTRARCSTSAR